MNGVDLLERLLHRFGIVGDRVLVAVPDGEHVLGHGDPFGAAGGMPARVGADGIREVGAVQSESRDASAGMTIAAATTCVSASVNRVAV